MGMRWVRGVPHSTTRMARIWCSAPNADGRHWFFGQGDTKGDTCTDKIATLQSCLFGLANSCQGAGHELVVHYQMYEYYLWPGNSNSYPKD